MQAIKQLAFSVLLFTATSSCAQPLGKKQLPTQADTLRGSITPERSWWDVLHYNIIIEPNESSRSINGKNTISFRRLPGAANQQLMQLDLQQPMGIDSVLYGETKLSFNRRGSVYLVAWPAGTYPPADSITVFFRGTPQAAKNPPWDGGWIWKQDKLKRPWVSVAVQ
ncbi:MAG: M1 family peptidase, partial [Chitinophagaceae bacterium]